MSITKYLMQIAFFGLILTIGHVLSYARNYEPKYTKANVPLWKQRACEKVQKYKANSHYTCDDKGDIKCLPGWQGDLCQVPMCRIGCDPMNGYCQRPGECRCRIGYSGELCDKCIPLPGCQHGDCTKPFECICRPGWDGLFCTEPTCRQGCHNTRGYCEAPGECRCRIGWAGRNCSDCSVLPGCVHGTCNKPLECNCLPGFTGLLCQTPICNTECHKQHGYCKKPGECRCKVGWTGDKCDQCFPYPGCVNGDCEKPWECNCKPGWGGMLCDEKLTYCKENPNICENNGKCVSLTKEDGSYRCHCKQGYLGKNCEIIDEFLLTSTVAPRITPPPLLVWEDDDSNEEDIKDKEKTNEIEKDNIKKTDINETILQTNSSSNDGQKNSTLHENNINLAINIINSEIKHEDVVKSVVNVTNNFNDTKLLTFPSLQSMEVFGSDIIGTATTTMNDTKGTEAVLNGKKENNNSTTISSLNSTNSNIIGTDNICTNITKNFVVLKNIEKDNSTTTSITKTSPTSSPSSPSTTMSPLSKLDDEKNLHTIPSKPIPNKVENSVNTDDEDEECTEDDNDEDCEYEEDEDEEDDDEEDEEDK